MNIKINLTQQVIYSFLFKNLFNQKNLSHHLCLNNFQRLNV